MKISLLLHDLMDFTIELHHAFYAPGVVRGVSRLRT